MVQEGARLGVEHDLVALAADIEAVKRADGRVRLAFRGAEAAEIVPAEQAFGGLVHRACVERRADMPDPAAIQRRWRAAVQDAKAVGAADG